MKYVGFLLLLCTCVPAQTFAQTARELVDSVIAAVGGTDALYGLQDVQYRYHYGRTPSLERYLFGGEHSYGRSTDAAGKVREEYYDGDRTVVTVDGQPVDDAETIASAHFRRKTNFYWLTMMHKLGDPGVLLDTAGTRTVEGIPYRLVDVTFEDGVGVAKDRYRLFINPYTHLVDQFLFTVAAVGRLDPIMMKYQYGVFPGGLRLPVVSQSRSALDWDGTLDPDKEWGARYRAEFSFKNGFTPENIGD